MSTSRYSDPGRRWIEFDYDLSDTTHIGLRATTLPVVTQTLSACFAMHADGYVRLQAYVWKGDLFHDRRFAKPVVSWVFHDPRYSHPRILSPDNVRDLVVPAAGRDAVFERADADYEIVPSAPPSPMFGDRIVRIARWVVDGNAQYAVQGAAEYHHFRRVRGELR